METIYQIICALCIISLRFPLYYLAPVNSFSYTDVMNNDTNLCDNPIKQFLSKSEYTKQCATLSYSPDIDKLSLKYDTMETFLCLGMHDATYKVCQYVADKKWTNKFNKTEDLDLFIQTVTGFKSTGEASSQNSTTNEKNFCEVFSDYTPTYKKVQPALSKLAKSLKDPSTCSRICIDLDKKLNPLCVVLAWINQIDRTITSNTIAIINSESHLTSAGKTSDTHYHEPANDSKGGKTDKNDVLNRSNNTAEQVSQDSKLKNNALQSPIGSINDATNNVPNQGSSSVEKSLVNNNNTIKPQTTNTKISAQTDASQVENVHNNSQQHDDSQQHDNSPQHDNGPQHDNAMTGVHQLPKNVESKSTDDDNKKPNIDKNLNNKTTSSQVEEIKSTTLSENTQDNPIEDNAANNPNAEDFSHVDDQLANNLIDSLGQPMDADDRNMENNLKDMKDIRVIKNEEESHFFTYFVITSLGFIGGYIAYHNKQKILAIVLEGRRSKNNRGRRRPSTANYRKLDCTLEEAVTSQCNANVTHVIY